MVPHLTTSVVTEGLVQDSLDDSAQLGQQLVSVKQEATNPSSDSEKPVNLPLKRKEDLQDMGVSKRICLEGNKVFEKDCYEMEGVQQHGWDSLDSEEQQHVLEKHGIPPQAATQLSKFGTTAHLTIKMADLDILSQPVPLYIDVHGRRPNGHTVLSEYDTCQGPYRPLQHTREMERGFHLAKQPIPNAPPWFKDLPWDQMEGITLEEFIIYFPNHLARWPGIALWLRYQSWDRLFYRTARLINLARGSHNDDFGERRHIEVLPLMMKIEKAIRELLPKYDLAEHSTYGVQLGREWFEKYIMEKPRHFPTDAGIVTLEEAAGYITGINEFKHREFSRKVQWMQPNTVQRERKPAKNGGLSRFPFSGAFEESEDIEQRVESEKEGSRQQLQGDERHRPSVQEWRQPDDAQLHPSKTGWFNPDLDVTETGVFQSDTQLCFEKTTVVESSSQDCPFGRDCGELECPLNHSQGQATIQRDHQLQQHNNYIQRKVVKINKVCRNAQSCQRSQSCKFLHPGDEKYSDALQQQLTRQFTAEDKQSQHQPRRAIQSDRTTNYNVSQRPSGGEANEPVLPPARLKLCRYDAKCTRPTCEYGHRSPAADTNVQLILSQWCRYGAICKNEQCRRNHPSPSQAANSGRAEGNYNTQRGGSGLNGAQRGREQGENFHKRQDSTQSQHGGETRKGNNWGSHMPREGMNGGGREGKFSNRGGRGGHSRGRGRGRGRP